LSYDFLIDLVHRRWIEVMQLISASPDGDHQIGSFQNRRMFGDGLARHGKLPAELPQGLTVLRSEPVEQFSSGWVSQRLENLVHCRIRLTPNPA
jgi:hypothetical protein